MYRNFVVRHLKIQDKYIDYLFVNNALDSLPEYIYSIYGKVPQIWGGGVE